MDNDLPVKERICLCCIRSNEPLKKSEIADNIGESWQTVDYHLPELVEQGLLLESEDGLYMAQPPFYESELYDSFIEDLEPLFNVFHEYTAVPHGTTRKDVVQRNVSMFITLLAHLAHNMDMENGKGVQRIKQDEQE